MPKKIKETKKTKKDLKKVTPEKEEVKVHAKVEEEDLPEDVQEALGIIKKEPKKKNHEVDYIAELENEGDEPTPFDEMDDIE